MTNKSDVDPRELAAFVAVADKLNFRRAAACLQVSPSVVSRRLVSLERQFGLRLVRRDSRTVVLTPEGREFLPIAQELLRQLRATRRELVRIAASRLAHKEIANHRGSAECSVPPAQRAEPLGRARPSPLDETNAPHIPADFCCSQP